MNSKQRCTYSDPASTAKLVEAPRNLQRLVDRQVKPGDLDHTHGVAVFHPCARQLRAVHARVRRSRIHARGLVDRARNHVVRLRVVHGPSASHVGRLQERLVDDIQHFILVLELSRDLVICCDSEDMDRSQAQYPAHRCRIGLHGGS